jgi:hypothetical protein
MAQTHHATHRARHHQAYHAGWLDMGRANYSRDDYSRAGPTPRYYAPNTFVTVALPGPHTYTYANGVRVWYGTVVTLVPVATTSALISQGAAIAAPASPGPRVYRTAGGVRVWYGAGQ